MPKTYKIVFDKKAAKFFSTQPKEQQKRLAISIFRLPEGDTKQLKGFSGLHRLRVGDYRIIYSIRDDEHRIIILSIGNRGDVYKKL